MDRDLKAAAAAVEAAAGAKGWNVRDLAAAADVDPATVTDFLAARRWPRISTRGALERALGWQGGAIATIADGGVAPAASSSAHERLVELAEELDRLTPKDQDAILAVVRQLAEARSGPPSGPDDSRLQGLRLAETEPLRAVTDQDRP